MAAPFHVSIRKKPDDFGTARPRFFVMVGANDAVLPDNRRAASALEKLGLPFKLNEYEGVGHDFPKERDVELRKALDYVLGR